MAAETGQCMSASPHNAPTTPVTICMVTYNSAALLPDTLAHLLAVTHYPAARWLVVDNASSDGTADLIRQRWPEVRVEQMGGNLGYPAAINRAFALADTELVAQVNPDVRVEPGWLAPLVAALEADTGAALAGGRILRPDGSTQFCGSRLHPWTALLGTRGARDPGEQPTCVDFHSPLFLTRRAAWQAVGGFDEGYTPGYYEDAELGFACRRAGWRVLFVPACRAVHLGSATFGRLSLRDFMRFYERNRLRFVCRNYPPLWLALHLMGEPAKAVESVARGYAREYGDAWRTLWRARAALRAFRAGWRQTDRPGPNPRT
jgi:GT2 family glycosyltransferase